MDDSAKSADLKSPGNFAPLERLGLYRLIPLHKVPISLSMKILLVLTLIVIVGFVVTLRLSLTLIYDNIWRETQDKLKTDLNTAMLIYDNSLREVEMVVDFTCNRFFLIEGIEAGNFDQLKTQLERIRADRQLDVFALVDRAGSVIFRTTPPYGRGDNLANDPLIRRALLGEKSSGAVTMTRERLSREGERLAMQAYVSAKPTEHAQPGALESVDSGLLLMAAYPVLNRNGELLAVLYGARLLNNDPQLVDSMLEQIFPGAVGDVNNTAMASIFFWDLRVATTIRQPNGNRAAGFRMFGEVSESALQNGRPWLGTSWVVYDWYFAAYEPLTDPEGKVIGAVGIGLWKGPFVALRDDFILRFVRITLVGFAVALAMGLVFSRMLTKPLRGLVKGSQELAKGNLNYRVTIKTGNDEIQDLEMAFNAMAQNLHASMEDKDRLAGALHDLNQRYMELLGFASHELKQPVGVISATISNLRKMGPFIQPEKFENILDRLDRNIAYIASMSEKYLYYSKIESGQLEIYPRDTRVLGEVIEPALEGEQKPILENKIKVEVLDQAELADLTLFVDPEMMRVVFVNLVSNAVKYGYQGGYLQIGLHETEDSYVFNVKNNGEGVPPDKLEVIFEKFKRLDSVRCKQKGAGLGLFNAKEIVELHGGRIWAESEPGAWANFVFRLPKERVNVASHDSTPLNREDELWGY